MFNRKLEIIDAHTHFFSYEWFRHFLNLARERFSSGGVEALAARLEWELPPRSPRELGEKWVQELDKHGVSKQVLFASKLNDAEQLAVAVNAFPGRLVGYVLIDPKQESAREQAHYSINILNMQGILMFPAMHHFHAYDENVYRIYEEAFANEVPVFIHFGQFNIPIFKKLGIPDNVNLKYSNPLDLKEPAKEFRHLNFIVPHFGCGRFEEALDVAAECKNVYFDTSSSNSWIKPPLTLAEVFKKSLEILGPERLLFGTDSSAFPRGWRNEIYDQQVQILDGLNLSIQDKALILGGNIARILNLN
ncbi:amidohydrolase family protein [candidate division KSB1 bacterium]|nr:amidohydrolase family protein [candidate division KSB1 bacterium]NIR70338.1 amidohydrolase family protein [candidate division KSB1 bacterium]NIS23108.1 amidohydrolase family protein [candidate division KSB1 bacterium]NIT69943.1 amidohydrolase family protein [candidate division KSB1 bacterium]NIU23600.1 amidohydrolase family protein [candidate division KSB1 bacterium]